MRCRAAFGGLPTNELAAEDSTHPREARRYGGAWL
jgi:hypothetical protein